MNYTEMLNKIIDESGLKNIEVITKLKEKGVTITPNYLSVLKNDPTKIASDEVSKAIAEVCNARYSDILVIQGQLDKLPKSISDFINLALETIISSSMQITTDVLGNSANEQQIEEVRTIILSMSKAELICEILENKEAYAQTSNDIKTYLTPQRYAVVPLSHLGQIKIIDENGKEIK